MNHLVRFKYGCIPKISFLGNLEVVQIMYGLSGSGWFWFWFIDLTPLHLHYLPISLDFTYMWFILPREKHFHLVQCALEN